MRFVILTHDHPHLHWDLMLEQGDVLWTWRLNEEPCLGKQISVERLPDHRKLYLDYEGPVSGDRGTVTKWDQGSYSLQSGIPQHLEAENLRGTLNGEKLNGVFIITNSTIHL